MAQRPAAQQSAAPVMAAALQSTPAGHKPRPPLLPPPPWPPPRAPATACPGHATAEACRAGAGAQHAQRSAAPAPGTAQGWWGRRPLGSWPLHPASAAPVQPLTSPPSPAHVALPLFLLLPWMQKQPGGPARHTQRTAAPPGAASQPARQAPGVWERWAAEWYGRGAAAGVGGGKISASISHPSYLRAVG